MGGAELQLSMFAWLKSVAGEVAVVPNGGIAKWSSKKRVPIAGYLCTGEGGPVLHTSPTPCLPTMMNDEGMPYPPPPHFTGEIKDMHAVGDDSSDEDDNKSRDDDDGSG